MSLKLFHIIFIVMAILLSFIFSGWAFNFYRTHPEPVYLAYGSVSLILGILLIVYEVKVAKKL